MSRFLCNGRRAGRLSAAKATTPAADR
jgi:hypothetical protein